MVPWADVSARPRGQPIVQILTPLDKRPVFFAEHRSMYSGVLRPDASNAKSWSLSLASMRPCPTVPLKS